MFMRVLAVIAAVGSGYVAIAALQEVMRVPAGLVPVMHWIAIVGGGVICLGALQYAFRSQIRWSDAFLLIVIAGALLVVALSVQATQGVTVPPNPAL